MPKIAIIGTTSWGITLGVIQARGGNSVSLWARTEAEALALKDGTSQSRAPELTLPPDLSVTASLTEAMKKARVVLLVVPSQTMRQNIKQVSPYLKKDMLIVSCAKGLEIGSNKRMSQVIAEEINPKLHSRICVLSGPNLAGEIAQNLPAATVIAAEDEKIVREAQKLLNATNFCVYTNTDVVGVELGGALKNIIALAAGIIDGFKYGDNAKAALITRGLTEITALGVALGANPLTFSGLAGMGDLIATCASTLSRNHYVGTELAKGRPLNEIVESMTSVAEGVTTTRAAWSLAKKLGLEMPITERMYKVLYNGTKPEEIISELIGLEGRHELAGKRWSLFNFFRRRKKPSNGEVSKQNVELKKPKTEEPPRKTGRRLKSGLFSRRKSQSPS